MVFAIAHKLVLMPKSKSMFELFMGIMGIACLFAIKKYLIVKNNSAKNEENTDDEQTYIV